MLKTMRQRLQESLGETSGAVEIEVEQLDRFERGSELPSEDILMLLISHFNIQDEEAVKVWETAGYDQRDRLDYRNDSGYDRREHAGLDEGNVRQTMHVMLLAMDSRVLYTNGVEIAADKNGLVLNFMQSDTSGNGAGQAPIPVSRLGMSFGQAEQLIQHLQRAMLHQKYLSGPKRLPPNSSNSK